MSIPPPTSKLQLQLHAPVPSISRSGLLADENHHLKQELQQLQHALATAYTPGHAALTADYERAEAHAKIAVADFQAANAKAASARAEIDVVKVRLENEIVARVNARRLVGESREEVGRLKKELEVLNKRECTAKKRISGLETIANKATGDITKAQQTVIGMKGKLKALEGELKKSVAREEELRRQAELMKRAVEEARTANRVLEEKLTDERATAKEKENGWQWRLEAEVARAKDDASRRERDQQRRTEAEPRPTNRTDEEERNKTKHKAKMTGRQPGREGEQRSRLEETIDCIYTLPPAPSLMDGNSAALLSPAPLAAITSTVAISPASESRSRFTSLPFGMEEESVDDGKLSERNRKTAINESSSESAASSRRGTSTSAPESRTNREPATDQSRAGKRASRVKPEPSIGIDTQEDRAIDAEQPSASRATLKPRPSKRRRFEIERCEKGGATTEKTDDRQARQSAPSENEIVERKAGGRTLRSRRRVSYDYNKAGRDIVNKFAGV